MRVAAFDLGTNSTRLLVADVERGTVVEVHRELCVTRLGEGVDATRCLSPAATERTEAALTAFRAIARDLGAERYLATATSAARDALNGPAFLATLAEDLGIETRLLSGIDEACTTFRGVMSDRQPLPPSAVVIDVGGGSTEFVWGREGMVDGGVSVDIGCVRATERWLVEDVVDETRLERARAEIRASFAAEVPDAAAAAAGIAVAGTATTLAQLDLGLANYDPDRIHGHVIAATSIARLTGELARATPAERIARGVSPGRAGVIVGGAITLGCALERAALAAVEVSERDSLHGIALLAGT